MAEPAPRTAADAATAAGDATRKPAEEKPAIGKALLDALEVDGVIGLWRDRSDIADSYSYARQLCAVAETRQ